MARKEDSKLTYAHEVDVREMHELIKQAFALVSRSVARLDLFSRFSFSKLPFREGLAHVRLRLGPPRAVQFLA